MQNKQSKPSKVPFWRQWRLAKVSHSVSHTALLGGEERVSAVVQFRIGNNHHFPALDKSGTRTGRGDRRVKLGEIQLLLMFLGYRVAGQAQMDAGRLAMTAVAVDPGSPSGSGASSGWSAQPLSVTGPSQTGKCWLGCLVSPPWCRAVQLISGSAEKLREHGRKIVGQKEVHTGGEDRAGSHMYQFGVLAFAALMVKRPYWSISVWYRATILPLQLR